MNDEPASTAAAPDPADEHDAALDRLVDLGFRLAMVEMATGAHHLVAGVVDGRGTLSTFGISDLLRDVATVTAPIFLERRARRARARRRYEAARDAAVRTGTAEEPRTVVVLRGLPGAGKSEACRRDYPRAIVCSADEHFVGADGVYRFDPARLGAAHAACLRKALEALREDEPLVVVDNTNLAAVECAPYAALAQALGYALRVRTLLCDPAAAFARQTHGVPAEAFAAMQARLAREELPGWWPQTTEWVDVVTAVPLPPPGPSS